MPEIGIYTFLYLLVYCDSETRGDVNLLSKSILFNKFLTLLLDTFSLWRKKVNYGGGKSWPDSFVRYGHV